MYSGLVKSFSPLNAYQKSYYPQTMIFFIDDSKYVRGTFLVFHKNALDFNNSIFSKGWTEPPCRSRWRLGRSGRGAGVASCARDGAGGAAAAGGVPMACTHGVAVGGLGRKREGEKQPFGTRRNESAVVILVVCLSSRRSLFPLRQRLLLGSCQRRVRGHGICFIQKSHVIS